MSDVLAKQNLPKPRRAKVKKLNAAVVGAERVVNQIAEDQQGVTCADGERQIDVYKRQESGRSPRETSRSSARAFRGR